ncbi:Smr/MutS family protein [Bacteroidota bacterium]
MKIGDEVRFLNEVGGGIIRSIEGKLVYVEDENGFEIPILENELVIIEDEKSYEEIIVNDPVFDIEEKIEESKPEDTDEEVLMKDEEIEKMLRTLQSQSIEEIVSEKEVQNKEINKTKEFKTAKKKTPLKEVDLHINNLIDEYVGLTNTEIIEIQINHFRIALENAMKDKAEKIVFIHGIGNGTLKNSLRKELETRYNKSCSFQDASFREYGYGATLVFIRQNKVGSKE